jgi:Siphovirus Gp157
MNSLLDHERHAARSLGHSIRIAIGGDEDCEQIERFVLDAIEGQTNFNEACLSVLREARERETLAEALTNRIAQMEKRAARFTDSAKKMRQGVAAAMLDVGVPTIRADDMTVSVRAGKPQVQIVSEDLLPDWAWRIKTIREPNKRAINERSESEDVPGTVRTNGAPILTIRSV